MCKHVANHAAYKVTILLAVASGLVASKDISASTLDQSYTVSPVPFAAEVSAVVYRGQSFTVGTTGQLERLELQIGRDANPTGPLTAQIRSTLVGGNPDDSAAGLLATLTFDSSLVPPVTFATGFVGVDLAAQAFHVTQGELLAIELSSTTPSSNASRYLWATDDTVAGTKYTNGQAFYHLIGDPTFTPIPGQDSGFRTFVSTPEPSSLMLGALGGLALLACGRRSLGRT